MALYILNHKRAYLQTLLNQRGLNVVVQIDDSLAQGESVLDRTETNEDFVAPEPETALIDLEDDFDDSAWADDDEDEEDDEEDEDEADIEREDADDDAASGRIEVGGSRRRRRRRGGRRDDEVAVDTVADDDEDDSEGRRRRRGRRGGRRAREDGDVVSGNPFFWVRGRTPSLEDPYVWFDPINPQKAERPAPSETAEEALVADTTEPAGEGGGRRRRRRGRGRGAGEVTHEVKVEARATNEGMPPDGSPDTPMAVVVPETEEGVPSLPPEPRRRRVRRRPASASAATIDVDLDTGVEPNEAESDGEPAILDVSPEAAAEVSEPDVAEPEPAPEPVVAEIVEPTPPPTPEIDVSAIIASDPNQVTTSPEKPKRGWWRR